MTEPKAAGQPATTELSEPLQAKDGLQLHHRSLVPEAPRAAALVVHGYGDHAGRYVHVLEALAAAGFAAHALDYRGHGRAQGRRAYVARFGEYLDDVDAAVARVREQAPGLPLFLVGHSLGGLIAALMAARPGADYAGVVLSAPYVRLRIDPSKVQLVLAKVVGRVIPFLPMKNPLTSAQLTHDAAMRKWTDDDPLYLHVVTPRWFTESNDAQARLLQEAGAIKAPLLVQVGAEDPVAHPDGGRAVHGAAGSADKTLREYAGMFHEIYNEVDRAQPIGDLVQWLGAHVPAK
jgi:alpha-beta hydrolase superfamily lysophospholipase